MSRAVSEAAMTILADKAKSDLYYLTKEILGYDLMTPQVHGELCAYVRSVMGWKGDYDTDTPRYDGKNPFLPSDTIPDKLEPANKNLLLLMPRGTFKSSVVTIGLTIQMVLNDPNSRTMIGSETFGKATAFLSEVKGHWENNELLRKIFFHLYKCYPDDNKRKDKWSDSELNLACRTRHRKEPTLSCAGVDVTKNGMHYDLIVNDDLHSEKNTKTKEQIENVIDYYKLAFSLLDPMCPMVVIGTRWDYNDLYQHIIDNETDSFNFFTRKALGDDGELLFPERLTEDFLDAQRKKQGSYIFSCQYMNEPVDSETAMFKRSDIQVVQLKDVPDLDWYLSVDPSAGGEYADYAALVVGGMDEDGNLYFREAMREKMNYSQIINRIFDLYERFKPRKISLEIVATQKNIQHMLEQEMRRRKINLPMHYVRSQSRTKIERVKGLAPFYELRKVYHVKEAKHRQELEYELIHFPRGKHDDVVDAAAGILDIVRPVKKRPSKEASEKKKRIYKVLSKPRIASIGR